MQHNIFFDLDSTLVTIEGLDYLATFKGLEQEIIPITNAAMNGELLMQTAMARKINLLRPSHDDILRIGKKYLKNLTLGAVETITTLQGLGHQCWILTGNFTAAAELVGEHLGIPKNRVLANVLTFTPNGEFLAFNKHHPLSGNGGKTRMLNQLGINLNHAVMIGDGNTDLETQGHVGLFIGFGGVVKRPKVAERANVYVEESDLRAVIPHIKSWQTTFR